MLRQGGNIADRELNVDLELADVVPSEERECESMAKESNEKEEKSGSGESSHGLTFLGKIDKDSPLYFRVRDR